MLKGWTFVRAKSNNSTQMKTVNSVHIFSTKNLNAS